MSTALMDTVNTGKTDVFDDLFDLDVQVYEGKMPASPAWTSISLCTPGCTSAGGGSNCSFCC